MGTPVRIEEALYLLIGDLALPQQAPSAKRRLAAGRVIARGRRLVWGLDGRHLARALSLCLPGVKLREMSVQEGATCLARIGLPVQTLRAT